MSIGEDYTIDKYKLINCLASGHNSQVWEVTDGARRVAMKLLLPEALKDPEQKTTLKHESKAGKTFDHPNIIKYHELVLNKNHAYFIMDLFNAPNIKAQIYNDLHSVHLRFKRVLELTCLALEHVHSKGWLHRDMKPDNVLSNRSSEVRLIDFSLAAKQAGALGALFTTKKKTTAGTRTYMAPEQILQKRLTPATDMYSLGIMVFEMLTGAPPFKGANPKDLLVRHINETAPAPSEFNKNVTPEMDRIVAKLLAKKPENRFKSVTDLLLDLRRTNVFKEPIPEKAATMSAQEEAEEATKNLDKRLDSRADAIRTSVLGPKSTSVAVTAPVPTAPATPAAAKPPQPVAPAPPKPAAPSAPVPQRPPAAPAAGAPPRPPAPMQPVPGMPMPQRPAAPAGMPPRPAGGAPMPQQPYPPPGAPRPAAPGTPMPPQPAARAPVPPQPPPQARPPQPAANVPPAQRPTVPGPVPARPPAPAPAKPPAQPAAANRPPQPAPAPRPAAPAAKPPAPKPAPADEGMKIDDLPSFDELPPII